MDSCAETKSDLAFLLTHDSSSQISKSYDSGTFIRYRECLTDIGIQPGKDADTVLAQVEQSGLDVQKCFEQGITNE